MTDQITDQTPDTEEPDYGQGKTQWWVLRNSGVLAYLGEFENFDEASDKAGDEALWIVDEDTAQQWRDTVNKHLVEN